MPLLRSYSHNGISKRAFFVEINQNELTEGLLAKKTDLPIPARQSFPDPQMPIPLEN